MADVSVDTETGIVKMNKLVAVQDCGMIVNPKTAESVSLQRLHHVHRRGALRRAHHGCAYRAGAQPRYAWYKLTGIGDYRRNRRALVMDPEHDQRGIVGLGEPPVVPGIAAIANAVANAIGVRVPRVPLTPDRVLAALEAAAKERRA